MSKRKKKWYLIRRNMVMLSINAKTAWRVKVKMVSVITQDTKINVCKVCRPEKSNCGIYYQWVTTVSHHFQYSNEVNFMRNPYSPLNEKMSLEIVGSGVQVNAITSHWYQWAQVLETIEIRPRRRSTYLFNFRGYVTLIQWSWGVWDEFMYKIYYMNLW